MAFLRSSDKKDVTILESFDIIAKELARAGLRGSDALIEVDVSPRAFALIASTLRIDLETRRKTTDIYATDFDVDKGLRVRTPYGSDVMIRNPRPTVRHVDVSSLRGLRVEKVAIDELAVDALPELMAAFDRPKVKPKKLPKEESSFSFIEELKKI